VIDAAVQSRNAPLGEPQLKNTSSVRTKLQ